MIFANKKCIGNDISVRQ